MKTLIYLFLIFIIISCSSEENAKLDPIVINGINFSDASGAVPKEKPDQIDIYLSADIGDKNSARFISYDWEIEKLTLDVDGISDNTADNLLRGLTDDNKGYYLDVLKNPVNAILTIFIPGYYKVIIRAYDEDDYKEYTSVIKVGEPSIPTFRLGLNLPPALKLQKGEEEFAGKLFYKVIYNSGATVEGEAKVSDFGRDWYDTGLQLNPLEDFTIIVSALKSKRLVEKETEIVLTNIQSDNVSNKHTNLMPLFFEFNGQRNLLKESFLVFNKITVNTILKFDIGDVELADDSRIFVGYLTWSYDSKNKQTFSFLSDTIDSNIGQIERFFEDKFLIKSFIGNMGIKQANSNYYIYFTPSGVSSTDLDPTGNRPFVGHNYGAVIGKLGVNGKAFHVGSLYEHRPMINYPLYIRTDEKVFNKIK